MKSLKIAIGTTSEQKIGYLKEVLDEIGINAEIIPMKVKSGVSDQPITEDETQAGSTNRARAAFEKAEDADFGIGIEVGYHRNKNEDFEMFCCTSIFGKGEAIASCFSTRFLLPDFHQQILKENKYLGEYVRKYKEEIDEPVINYTRELVRGRKPLIVEATRNVLLQFLELHATVSHLLKSDSLGYRDKSLGITVDKNKDFLLVQLLGYGENDWNFPGGEEDLINLCLRLAISRVISDRAGGSRINFLILDEVFSSQDEDRQENIIKALQGLSTQFRQLFLITHVTSLKDRMPIIYQVTEKNRDLSEVVLAS